MVSATARHEAARSRLSRPALRLLGNCLTVISRCISDRCIQPLKKFGQTSSLLRHHHDFVGITRTTRNHSLTRCGSFALLDP